MIKKISFSVIFILCFTFLFGCKSVPEEEVHVHAYSEQIITEAGLFTNGTKMLTCTTCENVKNEEIPSKTDHIPKIYLTGSLEGIAKNVNVTVSLEYQSNDLSFTTFATMEWQGGSSAYFDWSKRNYNIRFYEDETLTEKNKIDMGWGKESKYCLKGNFVDATQARNIVTARLYAQSVLSREDVPQQLIDSPNYGVIDGYPVIVYLNNEFFGLYTWNIPKDEWMFGMGKKTPGVIFFASQWNESVKFKALSYGDGSDWELRYESDQFKDKSYTRLNQIIDFVQHSSDETFVRELDSYIDVESIIDYMILIYVSGANDNTSKNVQLISYDGQKFYYSPYDLDATWLLHWDGNYFDDADSLIPYLSSQGYYKSDTSNALFDRVIRLFTEELIERYSFLRQTVYSDENISKEFSAFVDQIPRELYQMDWDLYTDIPMTDKNTISQIIDNSKKIFALLDEALLPQE